MEKYTKIATFIILSMLFSLTMSAQEFVMTSTGFVDSDNPDNRYVIFTFPKDKQQEIFSKAMKIIGKLITHADEATSNVEPEQIVIDDKFERVTTYNSPILGKLESDVFYSLRLGFKDGKMKVNAPIIRGVVPPETEVKDDKKALQYFYNKKGKLRSCTRDGKKNVEDKINELIRNIVSGIKDPDW